MSPAKRAHPSKAAAAVDWTGVQFQRVEYEADTTIFAQGNPATSVMHVEQGGCGSPCCPTPGKKR